MFICILLAAHKECWDPSGNGLKAVTNPIPGSNQRQVRSEPRHSLEACNSGLSRVHGNRGTSRQPHVGRHIVNRGIGHIVVEGKGDLYDDSGEQSPGHAPLTPEQCHPSQDGQCQAQRAKLPDEQSTKLGQASGQRSQPSAKEAALAWLEPMAGDPDLACDTRVAVPIYVDPIARKTRLWGTLGVRLAHLEATYARAPKVRPKQEGGAWQEVERWKLGDSHYVIPVDEFAEFEIDGLDAPTREEFREVCDRHKTKENIVDALSGR